MKALVEEVNSVQKRIKVELSQEDVKSAFDSVYLRLRKKAKIKGFRPGKAPLGIIKKFYGDSAARDVADHLIKNHLFSAIKDQSIQPIAAPILETEELPVENEPFSFSALIDILPAISVDGYKGLEISYQAAVVDDTALERELEVIQRRQAKTKDVENKDTPAAEGLIATVSQKAILDGEDFPPYSFDKVPVDLGKGHLVKEMESQILGLKVGEEKSYEITISENFQDESFIGKKVNCTVKVESLQELISPELNDDLAKDLGLESLEELKANIMTSLKKQAEQQKRNQLEASILDQLSAKNSFDVPPSMVDQVIDSMFNEFQFPDDNVRDEAKKDPEKRKELLETAKQRTKNTLILSEVIKAEKLEVNDDDLDAWVREIVGAQTEGQELDDKLIETFKESAGSQARESLLFKKAIDFIIDNGQVTETTSK